MSRRIGVRLEVDRVHAKDAEALAQALEDCGYRVGRVSESYPLRDKPGKSYVYFTALPYGGGG